ncbi:MAG: signal peptidase II [Myxococcales bacterium]|nr:signal peptidase II [Myxococcales bacterium]
MSAPEKQPSPVPRGARLVVACILGTLALTGLDLGTKALVEDRLSERPTWDPPPVCEVTEGGRLRGPQRIPTSPIVLIDGYLEFHYAENCGAAFGLMNKAPSWVRRTIFAGAAAITCLALLWMFARGFGGGLFAWSVPLIVSGALGNLVDRVRYGYVVDFIRFHWQGQWSYPTFNVADCTITVGVVLFLIDGFMEDRRAKREASSAGPAPKSDAKTEVEA